MYSIRLYSTSSINALLSFKLKYMIMMDVQRHTYTRGDPEPLNELASLRYSNRLRLWYEFYNYIKTYRYLHDYCITIVVMLFIHYMYIVCT